MRLSGALLVISLATVSWGAELTRMAEPTLWRYSRPDAEMLVGLNWKRLSQTEPGKMLQEQLQQAGIASGDDAQTLNSIDQVLISSMAPSSSQKSDPPTLITIKGRFNLHKLRQLALAKKATIRPYQSVEVITPAKAQAGDLHIALISGETIVMGDRKSLIAAIDAAREATPHGGNMLYTRAIELTSRHDLWFAATIPPTAKGDAKFATELLKNVKVVDGGLSAGDKLKLELNLNTTSEVEAATLAGLCNAMLAMLPADQKAKLPGGELLGGVSIKPVRSSVRLAMALDPKDMKKQAGTLGPLMGNLVAGNFDLKAMALPAPPPTAMAAAANAASAAEVAPTTFKVDVAEKALEPSFIKIYGLEGGTRIIPVQ